MRRKEKVRTSNFEGGKKTSIKRKVDFKINFKKKGKERKKTTSHLF